MVATSTFICEKLLQNTHTRCNVQFHFMQNLFDKHISNHCTLRTGNFPVQVQRGARNFAGQTPGLSFLCSFWITIDWKRQTYLNLPWCVWKPTFLAAKKRRNQWSGRQHLIQGHFNCDPKRRTAHICIQLSMSFFNPHERNWLLLWLLYRAQVIAVSRSTAQNFRSGPSQKNNKGVNQRQGRATMDGCAWGQGGGGVTTNSVSVNPKKRCQVKFFPINQIKWADWHCGDRTSNYISRNLDYPHSHQPGPTKRNNQSTTSLLGRAVES